MTNIRPIMEAYLLTLSTPIKPGAIHRLVPSPDFEIRLVEAISVGEIADEAYNKGKQLAKGEIDAKNLLLGNLIYKAILRSYERTEVKPLVGITTTVIILSASYGYFKYLNNIKTFDSIKKIMKYYIYNNPIEDTLHFIRGLEAVAERDLLLYLEENGITKRTIEYKKMTLGDLFEILSQKDLGFIFNYKKINILLDIKNIISKNNNILRGIINSYLYLLKENYNINIDKIDIKYLLKNDKIIERKYTHLLAPIIAGMTLILFEEPLSLPTY